jgi:hypothetical protein
MKLEIKNERKKKGLMEYLTSLFDGREYLASLF